MITLVLGASTKPERYSNIAIKMLQDYDQKVLAVGLRKGDVNGTPILSEWPNETPDTITLYLNPARQEAYKKQILHSGAQRVIFNPGTENPSFRSELDRAGIETVEACTLVMLRTNQYL